MPELISLRKFTLRSLTGHSAAFLPNVPTFIPDELVAEAMAAGCVPTDGSATFQDDTATARAEFTGDLRRSLVSIAIGEIVKANKPDDFDGTGVPKTAPIKERLGFDVYKKEVVEAYRVFMSARQSGEAVATHKDAGTVYELLHADRSELLTYVGDDKDAKGLTTKDLRKYVLLKYAAAVPV